MIITDRIEMFREAARHMWNAYFRPRVQQGQQGWDLRDEFSELYVALFHAIVCFGLPGDAPSMPHLWDGERSVLMPYRLVSEIEQVPAMISRDIPASGAWDYPTKHLSLKTADLRLISLFDWDQLGFCELRYYRARIIRANDPDLMKRDALIDVADCGIEYLEEQ